MNFQFNLGKSMLMSNLPKRRVTYIGYVCIIFFINIIYYVCKYLKKNQFPIQDYCDKAPVNVKATTKDNAKETNFECFYPDESVEPCSSKACHADISSILTPDAEEPEVIKICLTISTLSTPAMRRRNPVKKMHKNKQCPKTRSWLYSIKNLQRQQLYIPLIRNSFPEIL